MKQLWIFLFIQYCVMNAYSYDKPVDWPFSIEKATAAIAEVQVAGQKRGSGYFVNDSNTFITNTHVLTGAFTVKEQDSFSFNTNVLVQIIKDGKHYPIRRIRNISILHDLAVLEVDQYQGSFLEISQEKRPSDDVYVIGFFQNRLKYVTGHLLHYRDDDVLYSVYPHFAENEQLRGISGGPALNSKGQVIGTMSMHRNWYFGIIKHDFVRQILNKPPISGELEDEIRRQVEELYRQALIGNVLAQSMLSELFVNQYYYISFYIPHFSHLPKSLSSPEYLKKFEEERLYWSIEAGLKGHPKGLYDTGLIYLVSEKRDKWGDRTAFHWIKRAAQRHQYPYAEFVLGILYREGHGVPASAEKAFEWISRAADQGLYRAEFEKAVMYANGEGVQPSDEKALECLEKASLNGDPSAQFTLGLASYLNGEYETALNYFYSSALASFNPSQMVLGMMLAMNIGGSTHLAKDSHSWLAAAMLEGRFGWFADSIAGIQTTVDEGNPQEMADFVFMQLISSPPEEPIGLKTLLNLVKRMDGLPSF